MHDTIDYQVLLRAETPLAHHRESLGNHALLERRKVRQPDGSWAHVPAISGDSMRHGMREAAAYAFLGALSLLGQESLTEAALRLLFNGGMVTGRGDATTVKLDDYHALCDVFPPLALLGGCISSRIVPGRLVSEDALLVCEESSHLLPAWVIACAGELDSARAHIDSQQRVRMDPMLDPAKASLLVSTDAARVGTKQRKAERAHEANDAVARDDAKSTMMPRTFEAIAAGSLLIWRVSVLCRSTLDVDTFHAIAGGFLADAPRVGGKRGTGFGRLSVAAARGAGSDVDIPSLYKPAVEAFEAHVRTRGDKARTFLSGVDA